MLPTAAAYEHPQRAVEVASAWFARIGAPVRGLMVLARGEVELDAPRSELTLDSLMFHMAGGAGLNALQHELNRGEPAASPAH